MSKDLSPAFMEHLRSILGSENQDIAAIQAVLDLKPQYNLRNPLLLDRIDFIHCPVHNYFAAANSKEFVIFADRGNFVFQARNCEVELIGSILAQQLFDVDYKPTLGWFTGLAPYSGLVFVQEKKSDILRLDQLLGINQVKWDLLTSKDKHTLCLYTNLDWYSLIKLDVIDYILGVPRRDLSDILVYKDKDEYKVMLTGFGRGLFQQESTHPLTIYSDMSYIPEDEALTDNESRKAIAKQLCQSIEVPANLIPEATCALLIQDRAQKLGVEMFIYDKEEGVYQ